MLEIEWFDLMKKKIRGENMPLFIFSVSHADLKISRVRWMTNKCLGVGGDYFTACCRHK
jgi:hypothetical protein